MRKFVLPVVIVGLLAACSDYKPPAQSASSGDNQEVLDALKKVRSDLRALQEQNEERESVVRTLERRFSDIEAAIGDVKHTLHGFDQRGKEQSELLEDQGETLESVKENTGKVMELAQRTEALSNTLNTLKGAVDELKVTLATVDLQKFLDVSRQLAEVTGRAYKAEGERDAAREMLTAADATMTQLKGKVSELEARMGEMSGSDISKHPDFVALKKKVDELVDGKEKLQKDYDKMKALADAQAEEINNLKAGVPAQPKPAETSTPTAGFEAGFRSVVKTAQFFEVSKQFNMLVDLKEGEMPKKGDVLVILNEKEEVVCELKVTAIFDGVQFGGETIAASVDNPPTQGDVVRRRRAISAGGVDE
ncbi:MAG: hypothetical protein L6Q71_03800 [Planctomycetes bacterium]|nr:hypothetical protein [Planctomycetota bacterium]NUQ33480.1 hypothetical protein [Planctomycetaceae bacterium]